MLSIGEFARLVGVSQRMLRHYDGLGLLVPERVDEYSGYRFYSAAQLDRANRLVALKELGFRLEEVGEMLDEDASSPRIAGMLRARRTELRAQIDTDVRRMRHVEARLRTIERKDPMPTTTEFTVTDLPRLALAQLSARVGDMSEIEQEIGPMFDRVVGTLLQAGVALSSPGVAHYTVDGDGLIAAAAEQVEPSEVPEGLDAAVLCRGLRPGVRAARAGRARRSSPRRAMPPRAPVVRSRGAARALRSPRSRRRACRCSAGA